MFNDYKPIHKSIMVNEILKALNIRDNGKYLDATTGEGGHSEELLKYNSTISMICNDRDKVILENAKVRLSEYSSRIEFTNFNFDELDSKLAHNSIDGIIADLGISSYHFDVDNRGFSFSKENALDMRLDNNCDVSAYDIVNSFEEKEIADILYIYGEESFSRKIAKSIVEKRKTKPIKTTKELENIIFYSVPKKAHPKNIHIATKTFQALRIFVNNELKHIEKGIEAFISILKENAILCILTFHSLEDRIVKTKFR